MSLSTKPVYLSCLLLVACGDPAPTDAGSGTDAAPPAVDAGTDAGGGYDAGAYTRIPETEAVAGREGCAFERGAMPWETIGEEYPIGDAIPIRHIIVLVQENRSFDHYFGAMEGVDGFDETSSNPTADGTPVAPFHTDEYCIEDVSHSWSASHREYHDGANDGFIVTNDPNGERALGYLDGTDLPYYWDLARTFAMSDHHHCSVLGPTWVNRYFFFSGSSFGLTSNDPVPTERIPAEGPHTIWEELTAAGVSWGVYFDTVPWAYGAYPHYALRPQQRRHIEGIDAFFEAVDSGDLPAVSWVDPEWADVVGVEGSDEHPPANPQVGQAWVANIIDRVMASPIWAETAIVFTYDEHGGFYDHVPPPEACPPGDWPSERPEGDFDRLGFRVPMIVISPYARQGYVSDRVTDHTSVLRLIEARFLLPALTGRDANAWPMLDMFDFESPPRLAPPTLSDAVVDEAHMEACRAAFPEG
ncbi:MAG: alkaline phosphatase family protein [Sandaracinaceae bacterium]|nr:alkaline phosphatase family protein [Sandaracinaceae bacterium]